MKKNRNKNKIIWTMYLQNKLYLKINLTSELKNIYTNVSTIYFRAYYTVTFSSTIS